jgi:hypothetical protein
MLYNEMIAVYCENDMKHIDTPCGQNDEFLTEVEGYYIPAWFWHAGRSFPHSMFDPLTQPACVPWTDMARRPRCKIVCLHTARSAQPVLTAFSFLFTDKPSGSHDGQDCDKRGLRSACPASFALNFSGSVNTETGTNNS